MKEKVFTYGTLRRQKGDKMFDCAVLESSEAYVEAKLFKVSWFPAMVLRRGFKTHGTLLTIEADEGFWERADRYEGGGTMYKRKEIPVRVNGYVEKAQAWHWMKSTEGLEPIENGRFNGGDS